MSSDQGVFIIHRIPGRVRLGVAALRGDPALAERLVELACESPWVIEARANPQVGCLTVEYEEGTPLSRVLAGLGQIPELSECAVRPPSELLSRPCRASGAEPPSPTRTADLVIKAAARVNSASCAVTPPHVDLKVLVPGALVAYGLYRALTRPLGELHWITMIKYGFDTFTVFNQGLIRDFFAGSASPSGGKLPS